MSNEASLNKHIVNAQLPVLHEAEQVKLAAASNITADKKVAQNESSSANQDVDLDTYRRLRHQFGSNLKSFGDDALKNGTTSSAATSDQKIEATSTVLAEKLTPVSSFLGSTLGTMTGVSKEPIGSLNDLPNMLGYLMDRTNPRLRTKFETSLHEHHSNKLAETPNSAHGSLQQFALNLKNQLGGTNRMSVDQYYGTLTSLMNINKLKETLFSATQKYSEYIIDKKFPGSSQFLKVLLRSASKLPALTSKFGAGSMMKGATQQTNLMSSAISKFAKNPLGKAGENFQIESISQKLHIVKDPSSLLKKQLPPQFTAWTNKLGSISSFGRGGNIGYGFGQKLTSLQPSVLTSIFGSFGSQRSILEPILNRAMHDVASHEYKTQSSTLKDGTAYQLNTAGEKVLEYPRTATVETKTPDGSVVPQEKPISYFAQNKLDQTTTSSSSLTALTPNSPPPTINLGSNAPINLFSDV